MQLCYAIMLLLAPQSWMSKAFRCDAQDTPQANISNKKMSHTKWGRGNLGIGAKEPFLGPIDCQRGPICPSGRISGPN